MFSRQTMVSILAKLTLKTYTIDSYSNEPIRVACGAALNTDVD